jgi:hypothetical protein
MAHYTKKNYLYVEGPGNFITNVVIRIIKQQDNVKKNN